jgi:hypothetical protein
MSDSHQEHLHVWAKNKPKPKPERLFVFVKEQRVKSAPDYAQMAKAMRTTPVHYRQLVKQAAGDQIVAQPL